jgi:hypothetical protein
VIASTRSGPSSSTNGLTARALTLTSNMIEVVANVVPI